MVDKRRCTVSKKAGTDVTAIRHPDSATSLGVIQRGGAILVDRRGWAVGRRTGAGGLKVWDLDHTWVGSLQGGHLTEDLGVPQWLAPGLLVLAGVRHVACVCTEECRQ